jgi:hypothetical protein
MPARSEPRRAGPSGAWHRQPILWLGAAVFLASLAGCAWIIVASARHADTPLPDAPHAVFGVPSAAHSAHGTPP